jgi:tripartite-type tricarboxylate transporter receptor subunit TctC
MSSRILAPVLVGVAVGLAGAVHAQTFPSKVVRIVAPFPPGGVADITSRILAQYMGQGLGQPVIVDNRPGGGTVIGTEWVARAPGDGHTLLVVLPSFTINPAIRRGLSFEPIKDFKAVGQTVSVPMAIAVNPSVPARSLQELIVLARAKPSEIAYGTSGAGTLHHIVGEMLRLAANINIIHVPYQGGAPAITAAVGGHVRMVVGNVTEIAPYAKSGKVRPIVVTTPLRAEALPEVPTVREAGYPDLEATNWSGLVVPGATPPSAIARLNAELGRVLHNAEVQEKFKAQGMFPAPGTPEQFAALLESEAARYARVVREAGVKVD